MKKLILIISLYSSIDSFGQTYSGIQGFWPNAQPGKRFTSGPMFYQYPIYPVNDSTLGLDTAWMYNQRRWFTLQGRFNYLPTSITNIAQNKSYVMEFNSNKFLTYIDSVWNGSAYVFGNGTGVGGGALEFAKGVFVTGVGRNAVRSNTVDYATGVGGISLTNNTGVGSTGIGYASGANNTGGYGTFIGHFNGYNNTGLYAAGIGPFALYSNTGNYVSAVGAFSQQNNTGSNTTADGYASLQYNVGLASTGLGFNALNQNNWPSRNAIGYAAGDSFQITTNIKNFASANVVSDTVFISAHGFGTVGSYVNLKYNVLTGSTVGGLTNATIYQFKVTHADSLKYTGITSVGSGTYTLSKDIDKTNSTTIGNGSDNTKPNQIMLGGGLNTEVTGHGIWNMDSLKMPTGAGAGKYLISDATGIGTWRTGPDTAYTNSRITGKAELATANIFTTNGALSTPSQKFNGTWITGGDATTTKPMLLIEPSGTTSTGWSTAGTGLGINSGSAFTGHLANFGVNGTSIFRFAYNGQFLLGSGSLSMYPANPATFALDGTSGSIRIAPNNATATAGYSFIISHAGVAGTTQTSGDNGLMYLGNPGFAPTSGTGTYATIKTINVINQTGGANGITRGLWINNTITAAADWRSIDIAPNTGYGIYQSGASAKNYFNGKTGIGTASPDSALHVVGGFKLVNGSQASGKYLKSSSTGAASWETGPDTAYTNSQIALKKNSADSLSTVATDYVTHYQLKKTSDSVMNKAVHRVVSSNVSVKNALDNVENTVITATIPANSIGPNGSFHITILDSFTTSANNKTVKIKFNGTLIGQQVVTTTVMGRGYWTIYNRNSMTAQAAYTANTNSSSTFSSSTTGAMFQGTFDTGADITVTVTCTAATIGERMSIEAFEIIAYP